MKHTSDTTNKFFFAIAINLFFLNNIVNAQIDTAATEKRYNRKSCKIVYQFSNGLQHGSKTLIFDLWGNYEKTVIDADVLSPNIKDSFGFIDTSNKVHTMFIRTPTTYYEINIEKKVGLKASDRLLIRNDSSIFAGKKIGKEIFLGKQCDIIEVQGLFKIWLWDKIPLKKQLIQKVDDNIIEERAILVESQYKILKDEFDIPKGVLIQE